MVGVIQEFKTHEEAHVFFGTHKQATLRTVAEDCYIVFAPSCAAIGHPTAQIDKEGLALGIQKNQPSYSTFKGKPAQKHRGRK